MAVAIAEVVPDEDVEVALLEESQVVGVGVVDHVLVEHGVGVAEDEGVAVFVEFFGVGVVWFAPALRKEHSVDYCIWVVFFVGDPALLAFKILSKHHTELPSLTKKRTKAKRALTPAPKTLTRSSRTLRQRYILLTHIQEFTPQPHILPSIHNMRQIPKRPRRRTLPLPIPILLPIRRLQVILSVFTFLRRIPLQSILFILHEEVFMNIRKHSIRITYRLYLDLLEKVLCSGHQSRCLSKSGRGLFFTI